MTPERAIAMLDRQLVAHGQDVQIRKTNTAAGQITVRAFVRGYRPDEVVGIIMAGDTKLTISPTALGEFGIPPVNGFAVVNGTPRRILSSAPVYVAGQLARVDVQVRG